MSISKRVAQTVDCMQSGDVESALFHICPAIDATATKLYGKSGRRSYKDFIHENMDLITDVALGRQILNLNLQLDHLNPDLPTSPEGLCAIQDIIYHLVRCSLMHGQQIPSNIDFVPEIIFRCHNGKIQLPSSLIYGFLLAVVASPVNAHEPTEKFQCLNFADLHLPLSKLWGRRAELLWLFDAEKEFRGHVQMMQAIPESGNGDSGSVKDVSE